MTHKQLSDESAKSIGDSIIKAFNLKVKHNGRVDTDWGDKTPIGLGKMIFRILEIKSIFLEEVNNESN